MRLRDSESLPAMALRGAWVEELLADGILASSSHGSRRTLAHLDRKTFLQSLAKLREWLLAIPNRYVHFGDLGLAGISIFLTEFYSHLGFRATMLVPPRLREAHQTGLGRALPRAISRFQPSRHRRPPPAPAGRVHPPPPPLLRPGGVHLSVAVA